MIHEAKLVIDRGNEQADVFKTVKEKYPWLAIDFEEPRIIESVSIQFGSHQLIQGYLGKVFC